MAVDSPEIRAALEALLEVRFRRARGQVGFLAGARQPPDFTRIAARAPELGTPEPALAVRGLLDSCPDAERPRLRRLLAALVKELGEQASAGARNRELEVLASASVSVELERISLAAAMRESRVCADRVRRQALARGVDSGREALDAIEAERVERMFEARARLELATESKWAALVGIDAAALAEQAERVLAESRDAAMDLFAFRMRRAGAERGGAEHDLRFAMELLDLREHVAPRFARPLAEELLRALELDPRAGGEIAVDIEDRAERFPGVFVERFADGEIALAATLLGSSADVERACVGFGQAQHLAQLPGDELDRFLPDRARVLATGWVLARPLADPAWLRRVLRLPSRPAREVAQAFATRALLELRMAAARYLAAHELESHGPSSEVADRYRARMNEASGVDGFRRGAFALELHAAAEELRAFALAEQVGRELLEGFNEDWWRNPHASELLRAFWSSSQMLGDAPLQVRGYVERAA